MVLLVLADEDPGSLRERRHALLAALAKGIAVRWWAILVYLAARHGLVWSADVQSARGRSGS